MSAKHNEWSFGYPNHRAIVTMTRDGKLTFADDMTLDEAKRVVRELARMYHNETSEVSEAIRHSGMQLVGCPTCLRRHLALDDGMAWTGVCRCCGWCAHPAITGDRCDQCGAAV